MNTVNVYDNDYTEIDPSPMATQQQRYVADLVAIQKKVTYWDVFCTTPENYGAPECKVYEE